MRIPIRRGRDFTAFDGPNSVPVVIINDTMAREIFSGQNPLGRRLILYGRARNHRCCWLGEASRVQQGAASRDDPAVRQLQFGEMTLVMRGSFDSAASSRLDARRCGHLRRHVVHREPARTGNRSSRRARRRSSAGCVDGRPPRAHAGRRRHYRRIARCLGRDEAAYRTAVRRDRHGSLYAYRLRHRPGNDVPCCRVRSCHSRFAHRSCDRVED